MKYSYDSFLQMFGKGVVHRLNGATEARGLGPPDGRARQKIGNCGFEVRNVLRITWVFEIVDGPTVEQHAAGVHQERPRSLLGGPLARDRAALIVKDGEMDAALRHGLANLFRRLSGSRGDHGQGQLRMAFGKTVEVSVVANAVRTNPGPEDRNGTLLSVEKRRKVDLAAIHAGQCEVAGWSTHFLNAWRRCLR